MVKQTNTCETCAWVGIRTQIMFNATGRIILLLPSLIGDTHTNKHLLLCTLIVWDSF